MYSKVGGMQVSLAHCGLANLNSFASSGAYGPSHCLECDPGARKT